MIDALVNFFYSLFPCQVDTAPDRNSFYFDHFLPPEFNDVVRSFQTCEEVCLIFAIYQIRCMRKYLSNVVIVKAFNFLVFSESIVKKVHHDAGVFNHADGVQSWT